MIAQRRRSPRISVLLAATLHIGCGSEPATPAKAPTAALSQQAPAAPPGSVLRQDVVGVVDEGLGYFLQRCRVEPHLEGGRFSGFRVVELVPPAFWQDVDLKPGDVVTQVNGKSIEYPNTAYDVFESLREAEEIRVVLQRQGEPRQIVYPIVGQPKPKLKPKHKVQGEHKQSG